MDGKKLRKIRESLGESQAKFALRFDVSRQVIHHWEHRDTPSQGIGARTINRIIRGLPVSAALLKESGK
jgi:DNA-binding transcriptional regulator YiaG